MPDAELATAVAEIVASAYPMRDARTRDELVQEKLAFLAGRPGVVARVRSDGTAAIVVPGRSSSRSHLFGLTRPAADEASIAAHASLIREALVGSEAREVVTGGPAEGYLLSGFDPGELRITEALRRSGFRHRSHHVDLSARPLTLVPRDPRVERASVGESSRLTEWIRAEFATAWALEAERALHDGAVFVARGSGGQYVGFAAHSGNNAALGNFGPLGVSQSARRAGLGAALTRAALADLRARGCREVLIPWVDPALEAFYRANVEQLVVVPREVLARAPRTAASVL